MKRSGVGALVLALATVLGLVVVLPRFSGPARRGGGQTPPAPAAPRGVHPTEEPLREAGSPPSREVGSSTSAAAPRGLLLVRVVDRKSGFPLEGASLAIAAAIGGGAEAPLDEILLNPPGDADARTDARGEARLGVPSGISLNLIVSGSGPDVGSRTLLVPPLARDEHRELSVDLPSELDLEFWARVVSTERAEPIAGARIRLFAGGPMVSSSDHAPRKQLFSQVSTDGDGLAQIRVRSWKNVLARVDADGFGPVLAAIVQGHDNRSLAQVLRLSRSASLCATVVSSLGTPLPGIRVRLTTPSARIIRPEGTAMVGNDPEWAAQTDAEGRCRLDGLPSEAPLRIEILRGEELLQVAADPLVLAPGEETRREWRLGGGARLTGLLLAPGSKPMRDVEIWLARAPLFLSEPIDRYFWRGDLERPFATARTDSEGRFVFESLESGDWWVGPGALPFADDAPVEEAIATRATGVRIPPDARQIEILLRAQLGSFVRGRVLGPDGAGVAYAFVHATPEGAAGILSARSGQDGAFALGPLAPGLLQIQASGKYRTTDSEPVSARSGDRDVVLRLRLGGILRGRVFDQRSGAPCPGTILLSSSADERRLGTSCSGRDATFEFTGLRDGNYDLFARGDDGGVGILRGVAVREGGENAKVGIPVEPGARLRIRYLGRAAWGRFTVLSDRTVVAVEAIQAGTSCLLTVPGGRLAVRFSTAVELNEERGVEVSRGDEETEIVFRSE